MLEVGKTCAAKAKVGVEAPQPGDEGVVADAIAQHVEQHQGLAVSDRLGRRAVAAAETGEREVAPGGGVVAVLLQGLLAVLDRLPLLLLDQVVGEIGRQPLAPVAGGEIDEHAVAPPVVQDLVRVRRVDDERQPDYARAEQRERRHAEARFPEVLDQRELAVGIRAEQLFVHPEVAAGGLEILAGERRIRLAQQNQRVGRTRGAVDRLAVLGERARDQVDFLLPRGFAPALAHARAARVARLAQALAERAPASRQVDLEVEAEVRKTVELRVPQARRR